MAVHIELLSSVNALFGLDLDLVLDWAYKFEVHCL